MSEQIVLFGYPESPNAQKVIYTLALLRLPFSMCIQPRMPPRPDFAEVDITYRRIPLLSIGDQLYVDTSLIIRKLAELAKVPNAPSYEAFGNGMTSQAVGLIPPSNPMWKNEVFVKDRADFIGPDREFSSEAFAKNRPTVLSHFQSNLHTIQAHLLNNNKFFLGGDKPTIADICVFYVVHWVLNGHHGAEPEVTREKYPGVFEWVDNVTAHLPKETVPQTSWEEVKKVLLSASAEGSANVKHDSKNPLTLNVGDDVFVVPTDTGRSHPQKGKLIGLNDEEVCLQTRAGVVMHFPRLGYFVGKT